MAKGNGASSALQIKTLGNFIKESGSPASNVRDTSSFEGPQAGVGINKFNRQSTSFNFLNKDIRPGHVQALSKETTGSVYGGAIGETN